MPITKKKRARKLLKKQKTVVVIKMDKDPDDILFPEKVAEAKEVFSKAVIFDPRFDGGISKP